MFIKKVRYTDYDGTVREKTLYFNLSQAELIDMQLSEAGGLKKLIEKMIEEQDNVNLASYFKELMLKSYGEKSLDGNRFIKEDENGRPLYKEFMETEAYSEMYVWLLTGEDAVIEFIDGIIPKEKPKGDDRNLVAIETAKAKAAERFSSATTTNN